MRVSLNTSMLVAVLFVAGAPTTAHAISNASGMSGVQIGAVKHEVSNKHHRNRFSKKGCRLSRFGLRCGSGSHGTSFDARRNKQYGGSHGNSYSNGHGGGRY